MLTKEKLRSEIKVILLRKKQSRTHPKLVYRLRHPIKQIAAKILSEFTPSLLKTIG